MDIASEKEVLLKLNPIRILKQLSVFFVVSLMLIAVLRNSVVVNAYTGARTFSAESQSSVGSSPYSSSSNSSQFSTVPTDIPGILGKARFLGPVSPDEQLSLQFMLPLRDSAGLQSFLSEVYNPASRLYHHFLTPSQFYASYGPDQNEVTALIAYMHSKGIQVHISTMNPNVAEVRGTVRQIQDALKTQINSFSWNDQVFYSATSQAQLPSQFSNIQMIYGLENFDSQLGGSGAVPLYRTVGTVFPSQTPSNFLCYSPSEIRQMYNATSLLNAGYNGTGISIAIVDAYGDPFIQQELQNFSAEFRLPLYNGTLHIIPVGPYNASEGILTEWNVEIALDVEWAHAMAPNATINLYIAANSGSYLFEAVYAATLGYNGTSLGIYDNNIISMSWGEPENDIGYSTPVDPVLGLNYPWLNQVFQMDAAMGITALASSGDSGAYNQPYQTSPYGGASYPSTDPYVTGVGGTSLYMNTTSGYLQWPYANATGTYGNETAWSWNNEQSYQWGTGGGWSTLFGQPSWQKGPGVVNNGQRGAPDVSWDADVQTGVAVSVFNYTTDVYDYYIVGGTSVGSPSWAGSMALIDQKAGRSLGFINPTIYSILNNGTEYSRAFHDITVGNNNPYSATKGWDPLTGIGSPNLGELADYLAPTGQLPVVVTNDFSDALGQAYAYGQVVNLTAIVADNLTIKGPVTATITSSSGATIASNITLMYNATAGAWLGSYQVKSTDPPGEWSVTVTAINASSSGEGYSNFAVGDGVTIWTPSSWTREFYQVGDTIIIDSYVVDTSGYNVTSGAYAATFYLAQNQTTGDGLGKVEGETTLQYSFLDSLWEGNFTIPKGVDQGAWIIVVNGTDLYGNRASAYTWINVGLDVYPFTDSPTYVLGDEISIFAYPAYEDGSEAKTGMFTALITDGSVFVAKVPLTFTYETGLGISYDEIGLWKGTFTSSTGEPTGFYTITVNGTDGDGNDGSFATVIRVASYLLNVNASVSNPLVPIQNGNESFILAKITYPDSSPMTIGNVIGTLYLNFDGVATSEIGQFQMTYSPNMGGFVAINLLQNVNATTTLIGNYFVDIEAYDALGNYGMAIASFSVTATKHVAIDITEDSQFTAANGVIEGDGTFGYPYVIAGWNVSSISITNVTSSYELFNDYVSGSGGNGITINTPNSEPLVAYIYAERNAGCGLYANDSSAGIYFGVIAGDNGKDGILIVNDALGAAAGGVVENSLAYGNALSGIVYETSSQPSFVYNLAISNAQVGLLSQDSNYSTFISNTALDSTIGIEVTARLGSWYGNASIEGNQLENNGLGIYVNGSGQNLTTKNVFGSLSNVIIFDNLAFQNSIGICATNQAIILAGYNTVAENYYAGIFTADSLAVLGDNIVFLNYGNGIQIIGQSAFEQQVYPAGYIYPSSNGMFGTVIIGCDLIQNGIAMTSSGSGISVNNTNSLAILANYCAFNGDDGIQLNNVTGGSLESPTAFVADNYVLDNAVNGIEANNVSNVLFFIETSSGSVGNYGEGNMQNGIEINGGSSNAFAYDVWTSNKQDGMLFSGGSSQNYVTADDAEFNHYGYEITQASWNTLDHVFASENTGTINSPGAGVVFGPEASNNYLFDYSMLNFNDVGVEFYDSYSNVVQSNAVWYNTLYGFYFINGANNDYTGNSLLGNGVPLFPTPPSLKVTSPADESTVGGTVMITWNESGQSLAYTTVTIDGIPHTATANSFLWNTTGVPDGEHTILVNVTDTGGFWASQTIYLFTDNQLIAIEATISHLNQTLTSTIASEASLNATVLSLRSEISSLNHTLASTIVSELSMNGTVKNLRLEINSLNQTLTSTIASQASLNQTLSKASYQITSMESQIASQNITVQSLRLEIDSLNQTLTSTVASQVTLNQTLLNENSEIFSLRTQISLLNTTLQSTQNDVNGLKTDGYIAIIVVILALVAFVIFVIIKRRQ
jgi:parallel beta-helix repeat protein